MNSYKTTYIYSI